MPHARNAGGVLQDKGVEPRMVLESSPVVPKKVLNELPKEYCPHCHKCFRSKPAGVLPKSLFGNQQIANAVAAHYLTGVPMGRICDQTGVGPGALVEVFRRMAKLFKDTPEALYQAIPQCPGQTRR